MSNNYIDLSDKIKLYEYKNNYIMFNDKLSYDEINLEDFIYIVFERNDKLPFEDKKEDKDYTQGKYNALMVEIGAYKKKIKDKNTDEEKEIECSYHHIITNDLERLDEVKGKKFVVSSPITYIGRTRNSNNSRYCYGLAFDLDGVGEENIKEVIHQMSTNWLPKANIIVNSGNGLHLYYLFEKPIALFENIKYLLKDLKYKLTEIIWNSYTSSLKEKQFQGIFQGFRMPETKTKFNKLVKAFKTEHKYYTVDELNNYIKDPKKRLSKEQLETINKTRYDEKKISLVKAKELYPDWYERRIVKGQQKGSWDIKEDLYNWWLRKCYSEEIREGHRYFTIMALAMYGLKCNISYERLKADAYNLYDTMEAMTYNEDNHFTKEDIDDGLKAYEEKYRTFPRKDIAKLTGVVIEPNKRNGRKQKEHTKIMRAIQDITNPNWREGNGRKNKSHLINLWRLKNPNGNKSKCSRELNIERKTVRKWWDFVESDENFLS